MMDINFKQLFFYLVSNQIYFFMKNLKYFFGALLISAVAFTACSDKDDPLPPTDPGGEEPSTIGDVPEVAPVPGKIVLVLNCVEDAEVCNGLVFAGDYNGYSTNPDEMAKFEPIEGFDGWYRAEFAPEEAGGGAKGKPNQLASDGSFPSSWDYQWFAQMSGEDVVNQCELISGNADLYDEYNGEKGLEIFAGADVVYIRAYAWKKNPCIPAVTYTVTFNVTVPDGLGADDVVYMAGSMNSWTPDATPLAKTGPNTWSITLNEIEYGTEYKYLLNGNWDFEELKATEDDASCADGIGPNRKVNDLVMNDVVGNFKKVTTCFDADYPEAEAEDGKITIFVKFELEPCGDVMLVGSYNGWSDQVANQLQLVSAGEIDGIDWGAQGWYKVTVELSESSKATEDGVEYLLSAKPVQLKDGAFSWDYQVGYDDPGDVEVKNGVIDVRPGYGGECNVLFKTNDTAALIFKKWKNNPCVTVSTHNYTFNVTVPAGTPADAEVFIAGGMNGWDPGATPLTKGADGKYSVTVNDLDEGTEYKYVLNGSWDNEELAAEGEGCAPGINNRKTGANGTIEDTVMNWKGVTADRCPD